MVPATIAVASEFFNGPDGHRTFIIGPAVGAPLGLALAFLLRRRLWPQVVATIIGAPMAVLGGVLIYRIWTEPQVFLWEVGAFLFTAILVEGLALCTAGASGLALKTRAGHNPGVGSAR